jgi:thiamine pyrophosphate-dependent acetolactate synthase large subunit-like protein
MIDAAAELIRTLADEGVQHLFINPGTDTAPVQEALAAARKDETPSPRAVLCTHEFVALSAAIWSAQRGYGGDGRVVRSPGELPAALDYCLALEADGRCGVIDIQLPPG